MKHLNLTFLLLLTLVVACASPKSYTKKGAKLEAVNQYENAVDYYIMALKKKPSYVPAFDALKSASLKVYQDQNEKFFKHNSKEEYKEAVYTYLDMQRFRKKVEPYKVPLPYLETHEEDFNNAKDKFFAANYEEGMSFLSEGKFKDAEAKFNEIYQIEPGYEDVAELRDIAFVEPKYQKAMELFNTEKYRAAYYEIVNIEKRTPTYKDIQEVKAAALDAGKKTLVFIENDFKNKYYGVDKVKNYTVQAIHNTKDPFLQIVERDQLRRVMEEQQLITSGLFSTDNSIKLGELTSATHLVLVDVMSCDTDAKPLTKRTKTGFESYREKYKDSEGLTKYRTKYRKVNYQEFEGYNTVQLAYQIKIINLETGLVQNAKLIDDKNVSQVHYVVYEGKSQNLYPSSSGKVITDNNEKRKLQQLTQSRATLKSHGTLINEIIQAKDPLVVNFITETIFN